MRLRLWAAAPLSPASSPAHPALPVVVDAAPGEPLARAIWLSGRMPPEPLCAGLGRCGRCRVRFRGGAPRPLPADAAVFSAAELEDGWRLACRHPVPDTGGADAALDLELPARDFRARAQTRILTAAACAPGPAEPVLGVDLGTTTVCWRLVTAGDAPRPLAEGQFLNPQAGAGADCISRLAVARDAAGLARLAELARASLRAVTQELAAHGLAPGRLCVAANTAMTDILLERDISGLCAAPYRRSHAGGAEVSLPGLPPTLIPPLPAPFVGGDVSAGLAALVAAGTPRPFVLADLGTNGELALLDAQHRLTLASVPLGPALEGIGPECGQQAGPGVVTGFSLGPGGLVPVLFAGADDDAAHGDAEGQTPGIRGMSATAYVSLLACLRRLKVLDAEGRFARPESLHMPLARAIATRVTTCAAGHAAGSAGSCAARLELGHGLWLSAADIELFLKVKAAFSLALTAVCEAAGIAPGALARLCLAGALGQHARAADLRELGFAPGVPQERMLAVGNTALDGACLLAAQPWRMPELAALCAGATTLSLAEEPGFQRAFLARMRLED